MPHQTLKNILTREGCRFKSTSKVVLRWTPVANQASERMTISLIFSTDRASSEVVLKKQIDGNAW